MTTFAGSNLVSVGATTNGTIPLNLHDWIFGQSRHAVEFGITGDGSDETVKIQAAADCGRPVFFPQGVYGVDGSVGILITGTTRFIGESREGTVFKNISDNWRCVFSLMSGVGIELRNFTVDGDFPNRPAIPLSESSIRGEGIICWGQGVVERLMIDNLLIKNTGHYGIGLQNASVIGASITRLIGLDIGGDLIDIKDYEDNPKIGITINDAEVQRFGTNATSINGSENAAGFDLAGDVLASNLRVKDLYVEILPEEGASLIAGIRIRGGNTAGRLGGRKARVMNSTVTSSKLPDEGSETLQRIYGFQVADEYCSLVGCVAENCYVGFIISGTEAAIPRGNSLIGCTAINCKGESNNGVGLRLAVGSDSTYAQITTISCDIGVSVNSTSNTIFANSRGNTVDHNISPNVMRQGRYEFSSDLGRTTNLSGTVQVWDNLDPQMGFHMTHNGTWDNQDLRAGTLFWEFDDTTGAGTGKRIEVVARHTGPSAGETFLHVRVKNQQGDVGTTFFHPNGIGIPSLNTAYADDVAAANAGIPQFGLYRRESDNAIVCRLV